MKIAINGFGRIGRTFLRLAIHHKLDVIAVNDLGNAGALAHLFKYDSVHGLFGEEVRVENDRLIINNKSIQLFAKSNPQELPWEKLGVGLALESTGKFTSKDQAQKHLQAGARQVLISAPSKDIPMVVMGVNDELIDFRTPILSNASCTTNNVAPLIKVMDTYWGVIEGYITTVHSMTSDQNLHDAPHNDLRRARAAGTSIIPTTTGAAKAITHIFPQLDGKLGGAGIRVPVLNGSLTDFTCLLKKKVTVAEINQTFKKEASTTLKNIVEYVEDPIVSIDVVNNKHSCIFDSKLTSIVGRLVKVVGWYDNESGYAARLVDVVKKIQMISG